MILDNKLTGIPSHVVILGDMKYTKKKFVEIRGNIKHDLTFLINEREMRNPLYHPDQIIEALNRSSKSMEKLPQGTTTATSTGNNNNNDDVGVN